MREVLFRGKRADYGEWIEGYYAKQSNHACFAHELKYQHFIFKDVCLDFNLGGLQGFEIIPETVGQYTGLTDKNGVKIFEGDIVCFNGKYGKIVFRPHFGEYELETDSGEYFPICYHEEFEVRGNIYDDPELLEGGEGNG